jgi:ABC-type glycerol-3-phosphate transport system substrate-binding protein
MLAILAVVVSVLSGCLLLAPPAEAQVNWKQFSGTELRILNLEQPYSQGLAKLFPEFEKETGIKVSQETMAQLAVIQKIAVELASGTARCPNTPRGLGSSPSTSTCATPS